MGESEEALAAAIETLESLQRSYARSDEDLEAASKRRNEFTEDFAGKLGLSQDFLSFADAQRRDAASRMFSRYENPNWFLIVSLIVRDIEAVICQMGKLKDGKKIIFGTSPTGEINGLAADVNNPEYYIVLIEDGVFGYSNLLAKGIAHMFPIAEGESGGQTYSTDLAEVEKNIKKSPMLIMRLVDLVFAYIVEGHPHAAEPYLPDKRYADLASTWCQAILTFVLAHEFGHAWLGHLEEPGGNTAVAEESSIPLPSWERELQADHFALAVTLLVLDKQGRPPRLTYAGIEAFFIGLELIERTLSSLLGVPHHGGGDVSHPPVALRRARLREGLNDVPAEHREGAIGLATITESILNIVSPELAKFVDKAKQQGLAPHPKWDRWAASIRESGGAMPHESHA